MPNITYIQNIQPLLLYQQLLFKISVQDILTVAHSALPVCPGQLPGWPAT